MHFPLKTTIFVAKTSDNMGTNFYMRVPMADGVKDSMRDALENERFDELKDIIDEHQKNSEIHLGKRSCGWQFLWDMNENKYFKDNLVSIKEWLRQMIDNGGTLVNEYGEEFDIDTFINEEIGKSLYEGLNSDTYYEKYPEEKRYQYGIGRTDYTSEDGLRISTFTDFS